MTEPQTHPSDDDLVLLFYGELPPETQTGLREHVDDCPECRAAYNAVTRTLHLAGTLRPPDPGPDFEARVWQRVAPGIAGRTGPGWRRLAALAAAVAIAAGAGWIWSINREAPAGTPGAAGSTVAESDPRERVLLAAVDAHLVQTEMLFVELLNASGDATDALAYMQTAADDLVASGRLYRETARDTGVGHVVAVLEDLEPVLVQVARTGDSVDARDLRALQGRIEQDDLLFKVRAVSAELQDRQQDDRTASDEGAL